MRYFLFELKKISKKRSTWMAVILSILAVAGFYLFNASTADRVENSRLLDLTNSRIDFPKQIKADQEALKEAEEAGDSEKINDLKRSIELYEKMLKQKEFEWQSIQAGDWAAIAADQYETLSRNVAISKSQNFPVSHIMDQQVSMFTERATEEEKRLLVENGVKPFAQQDTYVSYLQTQYDSFTGKTAELWESLNKRYGKPGFYFLYQVIPAFLIPFIILIGCFLFGNNVSSEATKKRKGMNFYAVLPMNRGTLFAAKFGSGLLYTLLFVFFILAVPVLVSLFTGGPGSLAYPVLVYDGPAESLFDFTATMLNDWTDEFHFITLGGYLLKVAALTAVLTVFMFAVYYLLSLFIKNPTVNAAILLITTFFGMTLLPKTPLNPFTYVDVHRTVNREYAVAEFAPAITETNGMLLLGGIAIVLIALCYIRFRKYIVD